jgi:hypothetical protein
MPSFSTITVYVKYVMLAKRRLNANFNEFNIVDVRKCYIIVVLIDKKY